MTVDDWYPQSHDDWFALYCAMFPKPEEGDEDHDQIRLSRHEVGA